MNHLSLNPSPDLRKMTSVLRVWYGYNQVWYVLDWQGIEPMAMSISKLTIPPSHPPSYTLLFPPSLQAAQCLSSNGKPSILRHIYRKHAFAPLLHLEFAPRVFRLIPSIISSIMISVKMRLLFILSSSLILTHSNTIQEIESVVKVSNEVSNVSLRLVSYPWVYGMVLS